MVEIRERRRKPNPPMDPATINVPAWGLPVMGIDASLSNTGIAVVQDGQLDAYSLEPKKLRGSERLVWFRDRFTETVRRADPEVVVIEGYAFGAKMMREAMGELGGVLRVVLHDIGVPYVVMPPTSLKLFVTGKGNGPKDNMSKEIYKRFGVDLTDNNQIDAAGLAIMGLAMKVEMELTEFQKRALAKTGD